MKKILLVLLLATVWSASAQQVTNRYSMKLSKNPDGSYSLINEARYAKLIDLSKVEGLLEPYTYERERLQGGRGARVRLPHARRL